MKFVLKSLLVALAVVSTQNAFGIACADGQPMQQIVIRDVKGADFQVKFNSSDYLVVNYTGKDIAPGTYMACFTFTEVPDFPKFINIQYLVTGGIGIE